MQIAILQCDDVRPEFLPEFGNYPEMLIALMKPEFPEAQFTVFACHKGDFPKDLTHFDAYLTTGSRYSVYDDYTWIRDLKEVVVKLDRLHKKLVGICFGHQLVASALGGETVRSEKGWGIGVSRFHMHQHPSWMNSATAQEVNLLVVHQDQVVSLPAHATNLAGNDFCPVSAFQIGDHILCFQGHPEFSKAYTEALIRSRRDRIPAETITAALKSMDNEVHSRLIAAWIANFIKTS